VQTVDEAERRRMPHGCGGAAFDQAVGGDQDRQLHDAGGVVLGVRFARPPRVLLAGHPEHRRDRAAAAYLVHDDGQRLLGVRRVHPGIVGTGAVGPDSAQIRLRSSRSGAGGPELEARVGQGAGDQGAWDQGAGDQGEESDA